jgi:hypothetical protein
MGLTDIIVSHVAPLRRRLAQLNDITARLEDLQLAIGRIERRQIHPEPPGEGGLRQYEFKVFSQWGEDGIIQHLIHAIPGTVPVFVEFGVHDYREANTRFLLQHDNWSGLVLDASEEYIAAIHRDHVYYRNNLRAVRAFIDRDNINSLIRDNGITGDIGLLSIDIDGNDYWVWEAINCISPRIVICEYDSLLGAYRRVTTPYSPTFDRLAAHYSFLYGGASITALEALGRKKGYSLVGSNSAGNNAFFVRNDVLGSFPTISAHDAYVKARIRHSRDQNGRFTFLSFEDSIRLIGDMPLLDLDLNATIIVRDLYPTIQNAS